MRCWASEYNFSSKTGAPWCESSALFHFLLTKSTRTFVGTKRKCRPIELNHKTIIITVGITFIREVLICVKASIWDANAFWQLSLLPLASIPATHKNNFLTAALRHRSCASHDINGNYATRNRHRDAMAKWKCGKHVPPFTDHKHEAIRRKFLENEILIQSWKWLADSWWRIFVARGRNALPECEFCERKIASNYMLQMHSMEIGSSALRISITKLYSTTSTTTQFVGWHLSNEWRNVVFVYSIPSIVLASHLAFSREFRSIIIYFRPKMNEMIISIQVVNWMAPRQRYRWNSSLRCRNHSSHISMAWSEWIIYGIWTGQRLLPFRASKIRCKIEMNKL